MSGAQDKPRRAFPESPRRLVAPWWAQRAVTLATVLEASETTAVIDGERVHVGHLAELAQRALEMADRLASE